MKMDSYCGGCVYLLGDAWKKKARLSTDIHLCIWCDNCGHVFSGRCKNHQVG